MIMKIKKLVKTSVFMFLLCCFALAFSACSEEKTVNVTIIDSGTKTEVEVNAGTKVSEAVEKAEIKLNEKDETEPAKDEKVSEDTKEITIKRYAKVTVVKGSEKKEVELVGGTVDEAVKKAGFTLSETDKIDADKSAFLKDGMTITITEDIKVTLTADGKTVEVTTAAATVKDFFDEQKITIGKDDIVSEKLDTPVKNGMKLTVKRVTFKEDKKTEAIDFETEKKYSDSMNEGESKVDQKGVKGEKEIVYSVKYVDGTEESRDKVSEKVTKKPVNEIITYGTKTEEPQYDDSNNDSNNDSNYDSGSYDNGGNSDYSNQSGGNQDVPQPTERTIVSKIPVYDCDGSGHGYYEIKYSNGETEYVVF